MIVYSDELYHYGVKGMRWGHRRYAKYDGSYHGLKKHRAKKADKILTRMNEMQDDPNRMKRMSDRQKTSYNNAKEYWKEVKKTGSYSVGGGRNFIKRGYDSYRSRSLKERAAMQVGQIAAKEAYRTVSTKIIDKYANTNTYDLVRNSRKIRMANEAVNSVRDMAINELINKTFGHY